VEAEKKRTETEKKRTEAEKKRSEVEIQKNMFLQKEIESLKRQLNPG
jgi:LytS/YehU family sensor histidine kinase